MKNNHAITFVVTTLATLAGTFGTALAADADNAGASAPATAAAAPADADKERPGSGDSEVKHLALEINPLAAAIGRYSVQAEWAAAKHHVFVLNPHFDYVNADIDSSSNGTTLKYQEKFTGFGGELGYRFYTGSKGPNGFFVGPSVIAGYYNASSSIPNAEGKSFSSIGAALDIGGQAIIGPGILVGAGFGLQYTKTSLDATDGLPLSAAVIAGGGVRPRFLLSLGYAFL